MNHPSKHEDDLAKAIDRLAIAIESLAGSENTNQILRRILQLETNIMSAISEFTAKQKSFNDRQGAAIDNAVASVTGLSEDIQALNDKITELQNSAGGVTPEDQALIDALETQGDAVASRVEGVASALAALDAQTPPVVPPTP